VKIAHLSDLHITAGPALDDTREYLTRVVTDILATRPDLVLITGDLYGRAVPHRPSLAEREVLEPQLIRLAEAAPVQVLAGNHDHAEALRLVANLGGLYPIEVREQAGTCTVFTPAGPATLYWMAYPTKRWLLANAQGVGVTGARAAATTKLNGLLTAWAASVHKHREEKPEVPVLFMGHFQVGGAMLSSGEVLQTGEIELSRSALTSIPVHYGALGHVHERQEIGRLWWYVGSPWPCDFGEQGVRGWHDVYVGQNHCEVDLRYSHHRPWLTLDYRWSSDRDDGEPRWIMYPGDDQFHDATGAVVRARLVVPDIHAATCPWEGELAQLREIAHRVVPRKAIEPTERIRAPELQQAETLEDRMRVWWGTLASPPEEQDQVAALAALAELRECDDDEIREATRVGVSG